jgi:hypothetical protein
LVKFADAARGPIASQPAADDQILIMRHTYSLSDFKDLTCLLAALTGKVPFIASAPNRDQRKQDTSAGSVQRMSGLAINRRYKPLDLTCTGTLISKEKGRLRTAITDRGVPNNLY